MPKHLSETDRLFIVFKSKEGCNISQISRELSVQRATVRNTLKKYEATLSVKNTAGQGRKKKSTERDDRSLLRIMKTNRHFTAK